MKCEARLIAVTQPTIELREATPEGVVAYCMSPEHKVLRDNLNWVKCGKVQVGDTILGFDENGPNRKYRKSVVKSHKIESQVTKKVTLRSGKVFIVTPDHLWLISQLKSDGSPWKASWVKTDDLKPGDAIAKLLDVWEVNYCWDFGYLSGLYDGEGWLTKNQYKVGIAQKEGLVADKLKMLLTRHNFPYTEYRRADGCLNIAIQGFVKDRLKFLGQIRPDRLLSKVDFDLLGSMYSRNEFDFIESVEDSGVQDVVVMETSTGTLILDGYPHHNCARVSNPQHQDKPIGSLFDYCIRNKHWSIFQMCNAVIELQAPRDITRQFTRHSSMYTPGDPFEVPGFNLEYGGVQEFSQRYSDEIEFTDRDFRRQDTKNRQNSIDDLEEEVKYGMWCKSGDVMDEALAAYKSARLFNVAKECARVFLPEGLTMSRLYVNGTLRSWLHYLDVRDDPGVTQWEHVILARKIREVLEPVFPTVFGGVK